MKKGLFTASEKRLILERWNLLMQTLGIATPETCLGEFKKGKNPLASNLGWLVGY